MIRKLLLVLLLLVAGGVQAQESAETHTRAGDRFFADMAYAPAIVEYRTAVELGALNEHVVKRLAESYMRVGDTRNAEVWYAQVVKFLNREPKDLYNYAQALKSNGRYEAAEEWMDRYLATVDVDGAPAKSSIRDYVKKFTFGSDRFTVQHLGVNTRRSDMVAGWYGPGQVLMASSRAEKVGVKRLAAWNNEPFLDLYRLKVTLDGNLAEPKLLEGRVNSNLHEGSAVLDASGMVMWFTRTNTAKDKGGVQRLGIYKARRQGETWAHIEPFLYNDPAFSVGHPALSPDGTVLYFASDMPGGYGGTDLYMCTDLGGRWSEPKNLGPVVNTDRDEVFPFVGADGTLWFASDGHPGLGGLDIFATTRDGAGDLVASVNAGAPLNGPKDDFGLIIDAANRRGFFTSNREGGPGGDDIYRFEMHRPIEQRFMLSGIVMDDELDMPMIGAHIVLLDEKGVVVASGMTDTDGKYAFPVEKDREYTVKARAAKRYDAQAQFTTEDVEQRQLVVRDLRMVSATGIWLRPVVRWKNKRGFVEDARITLVNLSSFFSEVRQTGPGGDAAFRLQPDEQYEMLVELPGYWTESIPVQTKGMLQGLIEVGAAQDLSMEPVEPGVPMPLQHVRWDDRPEAFDPVTRTALDRLADRLQTNPDMRVEIAVHADTRLPAEKALKATKQRADAIVAYLRTKGVPRDNLVPVGYGTTRPLKACNAPGDCTNPEHGRNQRTEYTVLVAITE